MSTEVDIDGSGDRPQPGAAPPESRSSADTGEGESTLPLDLVFELLQVRRRRETLRYLRSNGGKARLGDLAEHIAAIENGVEEHALTSTQRKRVYIALYQCHLPKLDDTGVVDYEQARGSIELLPRASRLFRYLDHVAQEDDNDRSAIGRFLERLRR